MKLLLFSPLIALLASCAVTPLQPPPVTHPASPAAAEVSPRTRAPLAADEATKTTDELLKDPPTDSGKTNTMGSMPGMNH